MSESVQHASSGRTTIARKRVVEVERNSHGRLCRVILQSTPRARNTFQSSAILPSNDWTAEPIVTCLNYRSSATWLT